MLTFSYNHRSVFILISLLALPALVQAQSEKATLRVVVVSETEGTTKPGANILLTEPQGDTLHTGVTDANGFREFLNIKAREYQIHISFIGYETYRDIFTLAAGETRIYNAELEGSTLSLQELVVAGYGLKRREAGRQTVTPKDISRVPTPGPSGDLTAYLQTLPGVVTTGDRGGQLFIRGGTPSQNMVLIDNIPIVRPFHISNLYSAFPQETIGTVDLYAGGFGAKYKGATSSVLDVSLRQGNMRQFNSTVAASPHIASVLVEGPLSRDNVSLLVSGRRSMVEQTAPSIIDREVPLDFYDITGRLSYNTTGFNCSITALRTFDNGQINPQRDVNLKWSNTAVGSRCLGYIEEFKFATEISAGFTDYSGSEGGFDDTARESGIRKWFIKVDNNSAVAGMLVDYGFGFDFTRYTANLDDPFNQENTGTNFRINSFDELIGVFDAYFSLQWQPVSNVTLTPGLASQVRISELAPTLEPRLRATWQPGGNDGEEFSLAVGRYIQLQEGISDERDAGTVFYIYEPIEGDEPVPEALHGILGYSRKFGNNIQTSIEGYVKKQQNIPVAEWTRVPGNTLDTALAEGFTYGADLQVRMEFYPFHATLGYGLAEVTYEADTEDLVSFLDRPTFRYNPSHDRRHQISVISGYTFSGFTANVSWQFSSGRPYTRLFAYDFVLERLPDQNPLEERGTAEALYSVPFDGRLPSIHRLDISIERTFKLFSNFDLETKIGAINAYDSRNVFYFDVNTLQQLDQTPLFPYISLGASIK